MKSKVKLTPTPREPSECPFCNGYGLCMFVMLQYARASLNHKPRTLELMHISACLCGEKEFDFKKCSYCV